MSERLELVTDFGSLRAGEDVVILDCDCGDIFCRSQLTHFRPAAGMLGPGWYTTPPCKLPGTEILLFIGESTVASLCVFRVVEPAAEEAADSSSRKEHSLDKNQWFR